MSRQLPGNTFAEHAAMVAAIRAKDAARQPQLAAAKVRHADARTAEEAAWQATEVAQQAWNANPRDPALTRALAAADLAYADAAARAYAANRDLADLLTTAAAESALDLQELLTLGEQARAEQDAWFATYPPPPGEQT